MIPVPDITKRSIFAAAYVAALVLLLSGAVALSVLEESWSSVMLGAGTLVLGLAGMITVLRGIEKNDYKIIGAGAAATAIAALLILI